MSIYSQRVSFRFFSVTVTAIETLLPPSPVSAAATVAPTFTAMTWTQVCKYNTAEIETHHTFVALFRRRKEYNLLCNIYCIWPYCDHVTVRQRSVFSSKCHNP